MLGAIYYLIGAIAHFFGLTIFPFYYRGLYSPYHDTLIAISAIIFFLLLITIARDPIKNIDTLNIVITGATIAIIFTIWMIIKIDFVQLGAPAKKTQAIVEAILLIIFVLLLLILKPKTRNKRI